MHGSNGFMESIRQKIMTYDGSKGYMLQRMGLKGGECAELWNVQCPGKISELYSKYRDAGADVIQTNTFQGNRIQMDRHGHADRTNELNFEGARLARKVMGQQGYVAGSIGPVGELFEPSGTLTFERAYEVFREQAVALADGGADVIHLETFTDIAEIRAALIACLDNLNLPVICTMAFEQNGRTLMGTEPFNAAVTLKSLGASLIGSNCSFGPEGHLGIARSMAKADNVYLCIKPNAGLPEVIDGKTVYNEKPAEFARISGRFAQIGARLIGGCCGTIPEHVKAIKDVLSGIEVSETERANNHVITSAFSVLDVRDMEKINKGFFHNMVSAQDIKKAAATTDSSTELALDISAREFDVLCIDTDRYSVEQRSVAQIINVLQGYVRQPFIFKCARPGTLKAILRIYRGKAGFITDGYETDRRLKLIEAARRYGAEEINGMTVK